MSDAIGGEVALQNALMLARLLGDDVPDHAYSLLDVGVEVAFNPACREQELFANELQAQLIRTLAKVELVQRDAAGVSVGHPGEPPICWISMSRARATIASKPPSSEPFVASDAPTRILVASYACAFVVARVVNRPLQLSTPNPFTIERASLPPLSPCLPVDLGESWLLGAGAIGCAVLWALRDLPVSGRLHVVDPKRVTAGNLNRQMLFSALDVGQWKALTAAGNAQPLLPGLELVPHVGSFQSVFAGKPVSRVLVGLDSREARQDVQRAMPDEVFDASTTGAIEFLFHSNKLGAERACLECVYPTRSDKLAQARHMAEGLGLTLEEVQAPLITHEVAKKLAGTFLHLAEAELVGRAISSIYRENCAAEVLRAPDGEQFLAPFAFVSVLAGTLLVMHLVSQLQGFEAPYNLWPVSAWAPPLPAARELRGQRVGCFCTSSVYRRIAQFQGHRES